MKDEVVITTKISITLPVITVVVVVVVDGGGGGRVIELGGV